MGHISIRRGALILIALAAAAGMPSSARATLVARYGMDGATKYQNNAGASFYEPDLVDPGSPASPAPFSGAAHGTGGFQFDGTDDYFNFNQSGFVYVGLNLAQQISHEWTLNFWIKTTDANSYGGYDGSTEISVLGNTNGAYAFGIDGGKASLKNAFVHTNLHGARNLADGLGHYLTFVGKTDATMDIYVDGVLDAGGLNLGTTAQWAFTNIGRSYSNGVGAHYGSSIPWQLDDLSIYDTAFNASQVAAIAPEPVGIAVLATGLAPLLTRRRSRK